MVRTAYNKVASSYKTENLVSSRSEYESKVRGEITSKMKAAGFQVSQVAIVGKIRLPPAIQQAINDKIDELGGRNKELIDKWNKYAPGDKPWEKEVNFPNMTWKRKYEDYID